MVSIMNFLRDSYQITESEASHGLGYFRTQMSSLNKTILKNQDGYRLEGHFHFQGLDLCPYLNS